MAVTDCDRLTGGTFMVLLGKAKKPSTKARDSVEGKADGLNNQELLKALIRVFDPGYLEPAKPTFQQNTSAYRSCKMAQGTYLPFNQEDIVSDFDNQVRTNYMAPLNRMKEFVDRFINVEYRGEQLAKRLLGLVAADVSIKDSQEFFINADWNPVTKMQLVLLDEVNLDGLLLGLWHYIVTRVPDNTVGAATFERWHKPVAIEKSQRSLLTEKLPCADHSIRVVRFDSTKETTDSEYDNSDVVEAEIVDDEEPNKDGSSIDPGAKESVGYSDGRIVVFQGGTNNTNIGHVETLNLGRCSK